MGGEGAEGKGCGHTGSAAEGEGGTDEAGWLVPVDRLPGVQGGAGLSVVVAIYHASS